MQISFKDSIASIRAIGHRLGERRLLLIILMASFAFKVAILLWVSVRVDADKRFRTNDSYTYLQPAEALASLRVYSVSPHHPEIPDTLRTPGYPVFIAAVYLVAGIHPTAVVLAQIVVSLGTLFLVFMLAADLWNRRIGLFAAILLALDLASFVYSLWLLTETVFTFLLTAALFCAVRFFRSAARLRWCALFGLLFAADVLVRPIAYYLVIILVPWIALVCYRQGVTWRRSIAALFAFVLPFVFIVEGWRLRNFVQTGTPVLSRVAGMIALFYRGAAVLALHEGIDLEEARERLGYRKYTEVHPETALFTPEELSERWRKEGMALIREHPFLFARTITRSTANLLLGTPEHSLKALLDFPVPETGPLGDLLRLDFRDYVKHWVLGRTLSWLAFVLLMIYLLLLYFGTVRAWVFLVRTRQVDLGHVCLWLVFLYLLLISAGPEGYYRFRVPIMPILCIYAAPGLSMSFRSFGKIPLYLSPGSKSP